MYNQLARIMSKYVCNICDKTLDRRGMARHNKTKYHIKMSRSNILPQNTGLDTKINAYTIILKNKSYEKTGETITDEISYNHIVQNNYKIYLNSKGYACVTVMGKTLRLNRYIYHTIHENPENKSRNAIDHKNGNILDNRIENLRELSIKENGMNKNKRVISSSNYYGVTSFGTKWSCRIHKEPSRYTYEKEIHAAYHYDLLVIKHNLQEFTKINNIEKPEDFVIKILNTKKSSLPLCIRSSGSKFTVYIKGKYYGSFDTLENAVIKRDEVLKIHADEKIKAILKIPILRNSQNVAIIELVNKNKVVIAETMIDDNIYYELKLYPWYLSIFGYVQGYVNKKLIRMSRFIMKYEGPDFIDHIDGNPLNNQLSNLRVLTAKQNAQNRSSSRISKSRYIGVSNKQGRWIAYIKLNGKSVHLGSFDTEEEAARARDDKSIELNKEGSFYKINLPQEK